MPARKATVTEEVQEENQSVFSILSKINVNEHTEKKNGLTYLSWAWAWSELLKRYPESTYQIYENKDGLFYHTDGKTAWVKTGVTVEGKEYIEYLPVMDFKNKSIPVENITSFEVNKAIQRSLTKAVARHGLGLYIYAGEDLPEEGDTKAETKTDSKSETKTLTAEEHKAITDKIRKGIDLVTKDMSKEDKDKFMQDVVVKHIGAVNYMTCKDPEKLNKLYNELIAIYKKKAA